MVRSLLVCSLAMSSFISLVANTQSQTVPNKSLLGLEKKGPQSSVTINDVLESRISLDVEDVDGVKTLNLRELGLTSLQGLFSIRGISQVENIFLMQNRLNDVEELTLLPNLKRLWLGDNSLTHLPRGLEKLTQLEKLCLDNNNLTSLKGLEKLVNLEDKLCLHNNELTSFKEIRSLPRLASIDIASNPVTSFDDLLGLKKLKKVYVDADQNLLLEKLVVIDFEVEVYRGTACEFGS